MALFYFGGHASAMWPRCSGPTRPHSSSQTKTRPELQIPISPELQQVLDSLPRRGFTILTQANGQPWLDDGLRLYLQAWAHGLRKNAVNALLEAGCSAAEVSAITGQSLEMVEHHPEKPQKLFGGQLFSAARLKRGKAGT
jgi:hypothetical protein